MIPGNIQRIMQTLIDNGKEAYIIGGAVRDLMLHVKPKDYDIFTDASGDEILSYFPNGIVLGGEVRQSKILTVIVDGVEVSQYRKNGARTETCNSLKKHLATCDFTINAIIMDIEGNIINSTGDIYDKVLKFVGEPVARIEEDPLRILRAIRFACKYSFEIEKESRLAILLTKKMILTLPGERLGEELMKILKYKDAIYKLDEYGLLTLLIPELNKTHGMSGGDYHNETVFDHLLFSYQRMHEITDNVVLKLSAFLHDIGKLVTMTRDDTGIHFYKHELKGVDIAKKFMNKLKFSTKDKRYVKCLILNHMYSYKERPSKRSYIRFFNKLHVAKVPIEDYIMLIYADNQANLAKKKIKFGDFIAGSWLYKKYYEIKYSTEPLAVKDLLINGHDVMKYGTTGADIGNVLNRVFEKVMNGDVKNERHALLSVLKEMLK